jgi:hypothetical protein
MSCSQSFQSQLEAQSMSIFDSEIVDILNLLMTLAILMNQ